jgi:alkanesulfonate monooxygenase SsuD/methylene tetrahydromethanopterin reductase-like flavin-dependent oxidoreductase (luciferase family)
MQKPQLPLYLGGSSPNTFSRMAKYANGWIGVVRNDLRQLQGTLDLLKQKVVEAHRNVNEFEIIVIIYPNVTERGNEEENSFDFAGTIKQVGNNIERLKKMGVGHIILNYNRSLIEDDMDAMIDISKTLMTYAK